jgi:Arc/MetJ-type ribon-helix-helix transcriptional regulator
MGHDALSIKLDNARRPSEHACDRSRSLHLIFLLQSSAAPSICHPWGWQEAAMIGEIHRLRDKPAGETEKITINVGFVDLGHIDLLVHEGFYSNRTDFIRTAIRNQLTTHADAVNQSIVRHTLELGLRRYSREDLEAVKAAGGKLRIRVVGLATIAEDVTPELALATIESITVLGALQASKAVKAALSDRIG